MISDEELIEIPWVVSDGSRTRHCNPWEYTLVHSLVRPPLVLSAWLLARVLLGYPVWWSGIRLFLDSSDGVFGRSDLAARLRLPHLVCLFD